MSSVDVGPRNQVLITQSTFSIQQQRDNSAFYLLYTFVCAHAFHNSDVFDDVKCLPGTRSALLKALEDWASVLTDIIQPVIWLHGPAGAGKTAIARSLAEKCDSIKKLGGGFFFWRADSGRSDEKRLIPTLAYQLALSIPLLRPYIEDSVERDPSLFCKSLKHQLTHLILQPISQMRQSYPNLNLATFPRLIIIDGLDECGSFQSADERIACQKRTLEVLHLLVESQDIFPFKLLILSRTEYHLRQFFNEQALNIITHRIQLDDSFSPEQDILVYVTHESLWITTHHPHRHSLPSGWPGIPVIHRIANRSSGQFIYAATVMKFLRAPRHLPDKQLQFLQAHLTTQERRHQIQILNTPNSDANSNPFASLDDLCHQIISAAVDPSTALKAISFYIVHEMAFLFSASRGLRLTDVESTLGLLPGSIQHCLSDFESILNPAGYFNLEFYHTSFLDFLCDKSRSGIRHIDLKSETERFCLMDLRAFKQSTSKYRIGDQESWFHCFCEALMNSALNSEIRTALDSTWNDMASYSTGLNFFTSMGTDAGHSYLDLLRAYGGKNHPNSERQKLCQVLNDSMSNFLWPFIEAYKSSASLYALLLFSIFDPEFGAPMISDNSPSRDWACDKLKHILLLSVTRNPDRVAIDSRKLKITSPESHPDTIWIRSLLKSLYTKKYKIKDSNQPPDPMFKDDAALASSMRFLLDLIVSLDKRLTIAQRARSYEVVEGVVRGIAYSLSSRSVGLLREDRTYPSFLVNWLCNN